MKLKLLAATILCTGLTGQTFASDAIGPGDSESKWILGGSVFSLTNPYRGEDNIGGFSPTIEYNGKRFFLKNGSLNYSVFQTGDFSFGATADLVGSTPTIVTSTASSVLRNLAAISMRSPTETG